MRGEAMGFMSFVTEETDLVLLQKQVSKLKAKKLETEKQRATIRSKNQAIRQSLARLGKELESEQHLLESLQAAHKEESNSFEAAQQQLQITLATQEANRAEIEGRLSDAKERLLQEQEKRARLLREQEALYASVRLLWNNTTQEDQRFTLSKTAICMEADQIAHETQRALRPHSVHLGSGTLSYASSCNSSDDDILPIQ